MFSLNFMKKLTLLALVVPAFAAIMFVSGCKDEDNGAGPQIPPGTGVPTLEVGFSAKAGSSAFKLNDSFALTSEGFNYTMTSFKFYITNMVLVKPDNSEVLVKDVALIDFRSDKPFLSFKIDGIAEGTYKALKFGVGVDAANNAKLPSSFASDHPLNSSKGMHWDMAGYRFLVMEGRLDTTTADTIKNFTVPFVVHTVTNALYRTKTIEKGIVIAKDTKMAMNLEINMDGIFINPLNPVNFKRDNFTHTSGNEALAIKITDNLVNSITLK